MKRLIGSPWFGVLALTAAAVLTGTSLRLSFGQPPLPGSVAESPASVESPAIAEAALTNPQLQAEQASRRPGGLSTQAGAQGNTSQYTISAEMGAMKMGTMMMPSYSPAASDAQIRELIDAYRQHDGQNEKTRIAEALPDLVAKQFDARQLARENELKQLEEQLRKLQELHQLRAKQRDQIIQERVRRLLRDADGLGWGSDDEHQLSAESGYHPYALPSIANPTKY